MPTDLLEQIQWIVLHHTASDEHATFEDISRWHCDRGWDDVGYHWIIAPDGIVWEGRPEMFVGAHARGMNSKSIGICCVGNFELHQPLTTALDALCRMVARTVRRYHVPLENVIGHYETVGLSPDATATQCPGKYLIDKIPLIRDAAAFILGSQATEAT